MIKPLVLTLCLLCLAQTQRHGSQTLTLLARKGQRQKMLESMVRAAEAIPTNLPPKFMLRALPPPPGPPRTSTLIWTTELLPTNLAPVLNTTGAALPWLTWLERSTNASATNFFAATNWHRITPAVVPGLTNMATITNVWPQFIRAVTGWKP